MQASFPRLLAALEHSRTGDAVRERASPRSRLVPSALRIIFMNKIAQDILDFCMARGFWCHTYSGLRDTVNKPSTFKWSRTEINCHRRFSTPRQCNWTNDGSSYFPFFLCKHPNPHSSKNLFQLTLSQHYVIFVWFGLIPQDIWLYHLVFTIMPSPSTICASTWFIITLIYASK